MQFNYSEIEQLIGHNFKNKKLLLEAFTHSSFANESKTRSNEQMEFLGDAILELIVSEYLYKNFFDSDEGVMSQARAHAVSAVALDCRTRELGMDKYLIMGASQRNARGSSRVKINANLYEAVLCAIYLDGGIKAATKFVLEGLKDDVDECFNGQSQPNGAKTILQEYAQKQGIKIEYDFVSKEGAEHSPTFTYMVKVNGKKMGVGQGSTKQAAQSVAAELTLKYLNATKEND